MLLRILAYTDAEQHRAVSVSSAGTSVLDSSPLAAFTQRSGWQSLRPHPGKHMLNYSCSLPAAQSCVCFAVLSRQPSLPLMLPPLLFKSTTMPRSCGLPWIHMLLRLGTPTALFRLLTFQQ